MGDTAMARGAGTERQPRLALLDALRLLAALAVVLFHLTAWHHPYWSGHENAAEAWPTLSRFTAYGSLGVQLFFVISGFVVFRSLENRSPARFLGSRAGRLLPAFWFTTVFTGLLVLLVWNAPLPGLRLSDVVANLSLAGPPLSGRPWVDGVFWTLWIEVRFYVGLVVVRGVLRRLRRDTPGGWLAVVALWCSAAALVGLGGQYPRSNTPLELWLMPAHAGLFGAGMVLHLITKHGAGRWRLVVLAGATAQAAWATAQTVPGDTLAVTGYAIPAWHEALAVVLIVALVAALVLSPLRRVSWRWATAAGALTYPVYLLHETPGWWIIDRLSPAWPRWLVLALTLTLVLAAAWAVHRWVERPLGPRVSRGATRLGEALAAALRAALIGREAVPGPAPSPGSSASAVPAPSRSAAGDPAVWGVARQAAWSR